MGAILKALPPLAVALAGVGLALLWFYVAPPLALAAVLVVPALIGVISDQMTDHALESDKAMSATNWVYGWAVIPFTLAAAAVAAVIIVAVELDPGSTPPVERKEIFSAAATAIGTFLVAAFVKDAETADEKWVGVRFKKKFQNRFRGRFPRQQPGDPATRGELAVEEDDVEGVSGWGRAARKVRAQIVEEELANQ